MTPQQVLQGAIDIISDPNKWCAWQGAKNSFGTAVDVHAEDAVCWCALGAINKAAGKDFSLVHETVDLFLKKIGSHPVDVNDYHGRETVIRAMRACI
jgi:hypothetical protein